MRFSFADRTKKKRMFTISGFHDNYRWQRVRRVYASVFGETTKMSWVNQLAVAVLLGICIHAVCQESPSVNARHIVVPGYPALARQARQQGDVTATVTVDADGEVANVSVKGPDPTTEKPGPLVVKRKR